MDLEAIILQRFWDKVDRSPGQGPEGRCWIWVASIRNKKAGYGAFKFDGKVIDAHRVSFILINGHIPRGYDICHKCDNRRCIRPTHLFLGTRKENVQDMIKKGRGVDSEIKSKMFRYEREGSAGVDK